MVTATAVETAPAEPVPAFPGMPFSVDADGLLHLGPLCAAVSATNCIGAQPAPKCPPGQSPERGVFDRRGNPVDCFVSKPASYVTQATYVSAALDSELYRCQWHRIILRGEIPAGARVVVSSYTAEAELADDDIQNLGDVWETNQTATEMVGGEWDCLVRSGGGRFLWLRARISRQRQGDAPPRQHRDRISAH